MNRLIILFVLFSGSFVTAQRPGLPRGFEPEKTERRITTFESHIFKKDSTFHLLLFYKLPYDNLVFVKNGDLFEGGIEMNFDIFSSDSLSAREDKSKLIKISDYSTTNSNDVYIQDFIDIVLAPGDYTIKPIVQVMNAEDSFLLRPMGISVMDSLQNYDIFWGIPGKKRQSISILNLANTAPFSMEPYDLFIFRNDLSLNELQVKFEQKGKIVYENKPEFFAQGRFNFTCGDSLKMHISGDGFEGTLFRIKEANWKLNEGGVKLFIGSDSTDSIDFKSVWMNKPKSLLNTEYAIKLLHIFEKDELIETLFDLSESDYYPALVEYWEKYDKNKNTSFNEVMNEFYTRADYAVDNFSLVGKNNGAETDRGNIYIKFGMPDSIRREYTEKNSVSEIWTYEKLGKKFVFVDITGFGNYKLVER